MKICGSREQGLSQLPNNHCRFTSYAIACYHSCNSVTCSRFWLKSGNRLAECRKYIGLLVLFAHGANYICISKCNFNQCLRFLPVESIDWSVVIDSFHP